jgi:cell division protein FtsW (lipid II flippase)
VNLGLAPRWRELGFLLPLFFIVPLGFAITHAAMTDLFETGPLQIAVIYAALFVAAHLVLVVSGHRGDQLLLPTVGVIGAFGMVMLNRLPQGIAGMSAFGIELGMAQTQLLWFAIGIDAMLVLAVGLRDDGIQPGEFIKIVLVVFIAAYLAETRSLLAGASIRVGPISLPPLPYLLPMLALFVAVMLVVVISRDLGTALLFFGIFLTMLFVATGRRIYVVFGMLLFVAGSWVAYELFGHVQRRVNAWIDPFADPSDTGYQTVQALYGLARGGLFGEGLGQGLLTTNGQPTIFAIETDFIFTAVAEELGVLGAMALLAMALLLIFRGLRIAIGARDEFSALLAVGLTTSLGLQTLIIVGGNAKLIPLTGVTFPFVSYGGSSLLASFMVIGLLLSVSDRSERGTQPEGGP